MDARRTQVLSPSRIAAPVLAAGNGEPPIRGPHRRTSVTTGTLSSSCVIVIPCYNERRRLDALAFREFLLDHENIGFLFVNDGSTDGTRELLEEAALGNPERLVVLHLEHNSGKAEAVRRGLLEAAAIGAEYAGFWDADLATPLEAIPEFVDHLDLHPEVEMIFGGGCGCSVARLTAGRRGTISAAYSRRRRRWCWACHFTTPSAAPSSSGWFRKSSAYSKPRFARAGFSTSRSSPDFWRAAPANRQRLDP